MEDPYATVEIRNPNGRDGIFDLKAGFKDKYGYTLVETGRQLLVPAKGKLTYRVPLAGSGHVDVIARCEVDPVATAVR